MSIFKVPQRYKLMGYQPLSVFDAAATFVSPDLCRTLRTGAEVNNMLLGYF